MRTLHVFFAQFNLTRRVAARCIVTVFSLTTCIATSIFAQPVEAKRVDLITDKHGLSSNFVTDILQDKQGYLWIATNDGLNRYDGTSFKTFRRSAKDTASIQANLVLDIAVDQKDNIWYASAEGRFGYYDRSTQRFVNFNSKQHGLPRIEWSRIFVDSKGRVWIGFWRYGLYLYDELNKRFDHVGDLPNQGTRLAKNDPNLNSIADLCEDQEGRIWLATYDGLYSFNPENFQFQAFRDRSPSVSGRKEDSFMCIYQDSSGIWLGSYLEGIIHFDPKTAEWKKYRYAEWGRPRNTIRCFRRKSESELWISTDDKGWGVFNTNTGQFSFPELNLPGFGSAEIITDYSGVVWIASHIGIFRYTPPNNNLVFQKVRAGHDSETLSVSEFFHDINNNKLYFGTVYGDGLHILDNNLGTETVLNAEEQDLASEQAINIHDIQLDHLDTLWVVTENIIYILDQKRNRLVKWFVLPNEVATRPFFVKMDRSRSGDVWVASLREGIFRIKRKNRQFIHYREVGESAHAIVEDNYGRVWTVIQQSTGQNKLMLFSYEKESFQKIALTGDSALVISGIAKAPNGDIWISTQESGLFHYKASTPSIKFVQWSIDSGLPSDVINTVAVAPNGTIWATTPSLLFSINPQDGRIRSFPIDSNLQDMSIYIDNENKVFLETYGGYYVYDPRLDTAHAAPPRLAVNSVKILSQEFPLRLNSSLEGTLDLKHNQNFIAFEYAALDFKDPSKNQYWYKLDGIDPEWVNAGNRKQVAYANLRSGHYNFRVKAANSEGVWTQKEVNIAITIHPPIWERWYFQVFMFVILVLAAVLLYKTWAARRQAVLRIREKISRDLHDEMGSNLSTINILSNVAKSGLSNNEPPIRVREMLDKISNISSQVMESMDEIVWSLNPLHDSFEELVARMRMHGAQLLEDHGINFMFYFDGDPKAFALDIERRNDLYLIYKESINNILKYAKCKNVYVSLSVNKGGVKLVVADDGIGFKEERRGDGNGLQNMKTRSQNLNARLKIQSELNKGTRLELDISTQTIQKLSLFNASQPSK